MDDVSTAQLARFVLHFPVAPMMEVDGELKTAASPTVSIECVSRALSAVAAPGYPK
jgi:hypothetical protein